MLEPNGNSNTSSCAIAEVADEATAIIVQLETCDITSIHRLFELERSASERMAHSSQGAIFQLGVVNAHVDTILSHVPSGSPELASLAILNREIQRLLFSVCRLLDGPTATGGAELEKYYFRDPFETR